MYSNKKTHDQDFNSVTGNNALSKQDPKKVDSKTRENIKKRLDNVYIVPDENLTNGRFQNNNRENSVIKYKQ